MTTQEFPHSVIEVKSNPEKPTVIGNQYRKAINGGKTWMSHGVGQKATFHASKDAAWDASIKGARKACRSNPPAPYVSHLQLI